jgi:integration host factor subunit beta
MYLIIMGITIMNKSDLIEKMAIKFPHLLPRQVDASIKSIVELMTDTLAKKERIEIRGFGSFNLSYKKARTARNPKTGESVQTKEKYVPHFKPGKELKERVNLSLS